MEKDGEPLEFTIIFGGDAPKHVLRIFQYDAALAGVQINLRQLDWSLINEKLRKGDFDALYVDWGGGSLEFDPRPLWHSSSAYSKGGLNFMGYHNSEVDKLIDELITSEDFSTRQSLAKQIHRKINEDIPALFFFYPAFEYYAISNKVGQSRPSLKYDIGQERWWIKKAN